MKNESLKAFYTVESNDNNKPISPHTLSSDDPLCIDGYKFDTCMYLEKILNDFDLSDLLAKETEIVEQIKSLDAEMQTLVYENYNRFIYATDTIKLMKADFSIIENEMETLAEKVSNISVSADQIKNIMCEKRDEMKNLTETQRSIEELDHLLKTPAHLRQLVEKAQYNEFIVEYFKSRQILASNQLNSSDDVFRELNQECQTIVRDLRQTLYSEIRVDLEAGSLLYYLVVLSKIDEDAQEEIEKRLISISNEKVQKIFSELTSSSIDFDSHINRICEKAFETISDLTYIYLKLFSSHLNVQRQISGERLDSFTMHLRNLIRLTLEGVESSVLERIESLSNEKLSEFFDNLYIEFSQNLTRRLVQDFTSDFDCPDRLTTVSDVDCLFNDIINRQTIDFISHLIQIRIDHLREEYLCSVLDKFDEISHQFTKQNLPKLNLYEICENLEVFFEERTQEVIQKASSLVSKSLRLLENADFLVKFYVGIIRENLITNVIQRIHQEFHKLIDKSIYLDMLSASGSPGSLIPSLVIIQAMLRVIETGRMKRILDSLDQRIFRFGNDSSRIDQGLIGKKLLTLQLKEGYHVESEFCQLVKQNYERSLAKLIQAYGHSLALLIMQNNNNDSLKLDWVPLPTDSPSSSAMLKTVRAVFKKIYKDIFSLNEIISRILNLPNQINTINHHEDPSKALFRTSDQVSSSMQLKNQLRKLFAKQFEIYCDCLTFDCSSIILSLVKIILKGFCENVRQCNLQLNGTTFQIQIDVAYLQKCLAVFRIDQNIVNRLFEDIATSIVQRKPTAQFLDTKAVGDILDREFRQGA